MLLVTLSVPAWAQPNQPAALKPAAWFGLVLPHPASATPAVKVGTRPARPAEAGPVDAALAGAAIKRDVATIVGFATAARASKEIGSGQMWGRIAGFASSDRTVEWALDQFRKAGIADIRTQTIEQDAKSS